ncbi:hypothetical protein PEX1_062410 [Penicillium expansum]|nr:hypothetical protein PEX1_062410 [Penicillium expansum]
MDSLSRLPREILLMIFKGLDTIDDTLHLARSCRSMHSIFNESRHRMIIFKSIICTSPQHKYDIQLCLLQGVFQNLPSKPSSTPKSLNRRKPQSWGSVLKGLSEKNDFTDSMVWEIVCRWHAMKLLFDLYCDPLIRESFMRSAILDESDGVQNTLMSEEVIPNLSISCSKMNQIKSTRTQKAYKRFYQALTAHWVSTETFCIARGADYETSKEHIECFDYVWDVRVDNPGRALEEKLDILEVVDFVWGFLGRKIFPGENTISDWVDQDYLELSEPASPELNWLYFLLQTTQYLRPPHTLELLSLVTWVQPEACVIGDKSKYLSDLGFSSRVSEMRTW